MQSDEYEKLRDYQLEAAIKQERIIVTLANIESLLVKQNGRVGKLEERAKELEDRVTNSEKADIQQKAWLSGVAAGIGAVAALGVDKVFKFVSGLGA